MWISWIFLCGRVTDNGVVWVHARSRIGRMVGRMNNKLVQNHILSK